MGSRPPQNRGLTSREYDRAGRRRLCQSRHNRRLCTKAHHPQFSATSTDFPPGRRYLRRRSISCRSARRGSTQPEAERYRWVIESAFAWLNSLPTADRPLRTLGRHRPPPPCLTSAAPFLRPHRLPGCDFPVSTRAARGDESCAIVACEPHHFGRCIRSASGWNRRQKPPPRNRGGAVVARA